MFLITFALLQGCQATDLVEFNHLSRPDHGLPHVAFGEGDLEQLVGVDGGLDWPVLVLHRLGGLLQHLHRHVQVLPDEILRRPTQEVRGAVGLTGLHVVARAAPCQLRHGLEVALGEEEAGGLTTL